MVRIWKSKVYIYLFRQTEDTQLKSNIIEKVVGHNIFLFEINDYERQIVIIRSLIRISSTRQYYGVFAH